MPSRKGVSDTNFDVRRVVERLKQLDREEQVLAGLYFYESLTIEEIAVVVKKSSEDVQFMLSSVFTKILRPSFRNEKARTLTTEVLR